nr:hypothetical protein [Tanacetum cinerariifolium]GEZ69831.1 hypothetical protein [Tanacetum cinerariifolium]
ISRSRCRGAKVAVLVKSPGGKVYMLGEDLINDVVETGQPTNEFNECYGDVSAVDNSSNNEQESNIGQLEEMKKNLVVEDDNDSMIINNTQAVLDSDDIEKERG